MLIVKDGVMSAWNLAVSAWTGVERFPSARKAKPISNKIYFACLCVTLSIIIL